MSSGPRSASAALFIKKKRAMREPLPRRASRSENTQNSMKEKFQSVDTWVAKTAETT